MSSRREVRGAGHNHPISFSFPQIYDPLELLLQH